jgi:hypothetical protein
VLVDSVKEAFEDIGQKVDRAWWFLENLLDPNDWRMESECHWDPAHAPHDPGTHARMGLWERVLEATRYTPTV